MGDRWKAEAELAWAGAGAGAGAGLRWKSARHMYVLYVLYLHNV